MKHHRLGLGTTVAFVGDPLIYETADYTGALICESDCDCPHDCNDIPMVCVSHTYRTWKPLSELRTIFDGEFRGYYDPIPNCIGRSPTQAELELEIK